MLLTIQGLLLIGAFAITLIHAMGKAPLWPAVLLVIVSMLVALGGVVR
jgi:hypothetical protein